MDTYNSEMNTACPIKLYGAKSWQHLQPEASKKHAPFERQWEVGNTSLNFQTKSPKTQLIIQEHKGEADWGEGNDKESWRSH